MFGNFFQMKKGAMINMDLHINYCEILPLENIFFLYRSEAYLEAVTRDVL